MQNILNQKKDLLIIVEKGTYYYPAYKHYGRMTNVCCDFCSKSNLDCCVGFEDKDLCLRCVELFVENDKKNNINPNNNFPQMTNLYRYPHQQTNQHIITKMMQDSVRNNPNPTNIRMITKMKQDSVRNNPTKMDSLMQTVENTKTHTFMMQSSTRPKSTFDDM